eukprot:3228099-Rhodomonas_salina.3
MQKKTLSVPPLSPAFVSGLHHPRSFYSSSLSASPLSHRCARIPESDTHIVFRLVLIAASSSCSCSCSSLFRSSSHHWPSLKPFLSSRRRSTPGELRYAPLCYLPARELCTLPAYACTTGISQLRALAFDPNSPGKNEEERAREEVVRCHTLGHMYDTK